VKVRHQGDGCFITSGSYESGQWAGFAEDNINLLLSNCLHKVPDLLNLLVNRRFS